MKNSQSGRSMVEMLAVLAIMGVLSVCGVAGYTTAMLKYKTNEILSGVRDRALAVSAYQGFNGGTAQDLLEYKDQKLKGYDVSLYPSKIEGSDFAIQIEKVDKEMCDRIAEQGLVSAVLVRPNLCDAEDSNTLIFGFKNDLEGWENSRGDPGTISSYTPKNEQANDTCDDEDALQCSGDMVQKCRKNGSNELHWYNHEDCLYGCLGGVCNSRNCSPNGSYKCRGNYLLSCSSGQWSEPGEDKTGTRMCKWDCTNDSGETRCSEDCKSGELYYYMGVLSGSVFVYECLSGTYYGHEVDLETECSASDDYTTCIATKNDLDDTKRVP